MNVKGEVSLSRRTTNISRRASSVKGSIGGGGETELSEEQLDGLYAWLEEIKLSRPKKNLTREFSDGVLMAELLKQFFPRRVDLNNYRTANSTPNKLKNWQWLNEKVLKPLGIGQDDKTLRDIIDFNVTKLERLLILVKEKVDEQEEMKTKKEQDLHSTIYGVGRVEELDLTSMVKDYGALKEELQEKNEEISTLNAKIEHLEAMLEIKDQRLDDLLVQVKSCTCSLYNSASPVDPPVRAGARRSLPATSAPSTPLIQSSMFL